MAVDYDDDLVGAFDEWYIERTEDERNGCIKFRGLSEPAGALLRKYDDYKREMDSRCANYHKWIMMADGEVVSPKPDLPNVSSGETAGLVRRMARNLVQHAPNVQILNEFDDDSVYGVFAEFILRSKIIGSDSYSNDMQQNLFASTKTAITTGFDCVIPCLLQDASGAWYVKYDTIHYRDVFPEPGAKDVRDATDVFVRRYLTPGEVKALIQQQPEGWDVAALRELLRRSPKPPTKEHQSQSTQDIRRKHMVDGYEIITWYSSGGGKFLSFSPRHQLLFRVEDNVHPLKQHPVFFLVLEKDAQQPLGKSQVELLYGRQEFQDLMHNGAMKLWYRNINPSIIGYGTVGSIPNLSPGKYTQISNPNARLEPFEVSTQTLLQYNVISQSNMGAMVNLVGSADQQMAQSAGNGMSATPQGVDAQQMLVDITTNNYQKAIESFFSHYCSYALTMYFQEMKGVKKVTPNADTRWKLLNAGVPVESFDDKGVMKIDMSEMAVLYFVRCVPGSLVELEDEKQLRILNQLFIPLSQAMPALAATQDPQMLKNAAIAMQFILEKEIELSGSNRSGELKSLFTTGRTPDQQTFDTQVTDLESSIGNVSSATTDGLAMTASAIQQLQEQMRILSETQGAILQKLGVGNQQPAPVNAQMS